MSILPENRVLAAPLAGISDSVYRRWARRFGAGMVFTEMVSAEGLRRGNRKTKAILSITDEERPVGAQLFDDSPEAIADATKVVQHSGFDIVDINLGRPARKVVNRGAGASLLREPETAKRLVEAATNTAQIPVSVKMRTGWEDDDETYLELIPAFADVGVAFITLHPRSRSSMFYERSDWRKIKRAVEISPIPIVGNGDIRSGEDAARMLEETGCAAVMIGRASLGYPWIFEEASRAINALKAPEKPSFEEKLDACAEYVRDLVSLYGDERGTKIARKHIIWFTKGLPGCKEVKKKAFATTSLDEITTILNDRKAEISAS